METTDIDKKIGMPDVDAEWARFEREVIGEETQPKKHSLALWAWGIGIAASIAVVAGLFLFGNRSKEKNEGSVAMAEENKSEVPEKKDANDGNAESAITSNIIDNKSENLLAEVSDSETQNSLQSVFFRCISKYFVFVGSLGWLRLNIDDTVLCKFTIFLYIRAFVILVLIDHDALNILFEEMLKILFRGNLFFCHKHRLSIDHNKY